VVLLCAAALGVGLAGCDGGGTAVLITVAGLDGQVTELGVVAVLDNGSRQAFPRQRLADALSASQQLAVLLPSGAGAAVSIEVDGYLGDCLVQSGQALVALTSEPLLSARVALGQPTTCAPLNLQVVGPGVVTSRDAPNLNCGPSANCMYWLDDVHTYALTATPSTSGTIIDWIIDGTPAADCANLPQCTVDLSASGHVVTVIFNQSCDANQMLAAPSGLSFAANSSLHAVWGVAGQEAWAVGDFGTVARYHGGSWSLVTLRDKSSGTQINDTLTALWGQGSPAALYIVGHPTGASTAGSSYLLQNTLNDTGTLVNVTTLTPVGAGLLGIAGADTMSLWAVGYGGAIFKWNPGSGKLEAPTLSGSPPSSDLNGVAVGSEPAHTVWTVTDKSLLYSVSGSLWSSVSGGAPTTVKLLAVAQDSGYTYAVGTQSTLIRIPRSGPPMPVATKVATSGADANRTLNAVWAGNGYVLAVGDGGSVFCSRSSGAYFTRLALPSAGAVTFQGVYGSNNHLWVVGQNSSAGVLLEGTLP
jgi:hypothetical protein